jgi:hypothetical protein
MNTGDYYKIVRNVLKDSAHHQHQPKDDQGDAQWCGNDQCGQHNADDHDCQPDNSRHQPSCQFNDALDQVHQYFERPKQPGGLLC